MRVLFIVNTFPPSYTGGAEVATYHTCRELIRQGIDCSILVCNNRVSEFADEWYELDGIPVHRVVHMVPRSALTDLFDLRIYRAVKAELRRLRPDVVHMQNVSGTTLAPYLACRTVGIPVVNTLHDLWLLCPNNMLYRRDGSFCDPGQNPHGCGDCFRSYDFWANIPYRREIFAALTSNTRVFVSPSQALIARHVEAGYAPDRFRLVRFGLEASLAEARSYPRFEQIVTTDSKHRTVVFAGGGVRIKGANVLLQALPGLLRCDKHLQVIVAGGGEKCILTQFHQYAPAVRVLGMVPFADMRILFALADLTLVPSVWHENSPIVIYESLHAGTPVVGSRLGGIPELIKDNETGYLCEVGDPAALAEAIAHHFSRSALERRLMRRRCVEAARTQLTLESHIQGIMKVYQEVLRS